MSSAIQVVKSEPFWELQFQFLYKYYVYKWLAIIFLIIGQRASYKEGSRSAGQLPWCKWCVQQSSFTIHNMWDNLLEQNLGSVLVSRGESGYLHTMNISLINVYLLSSEQWQPSHLGHGPCTLNTGQTYQRYIHPQDILVSAFPCRHLNSPPPQHLQFLGWILRLKLLNLWLSLPSHLLHIHIQLLI